MKERKRFLLYYDWENLIKWMNDQDIASLTREIFRYQNTWEIWEMTYWASLAFSFMQPVFDEDKKDWEEIREKRVKAGKEWWIAKAEASKTKQNVASASKTKQDLAVIDIDSVSGIVIDTVIDNTETNSTIVLWDKSLEPIEKKDNRDKWTQRVIEIIKDQVQKEWFLYDNNSEERRRATIIGKRQSDWWDFIKNTAEEREEEIIRSIVSYSLQNEYVSKVQSVRDFHEKWKKVANAMKQSSNELKNKEPVLHPDPLCRF